MVYGTKAILALIIFSLCLLTSCVSDNQDVEQPAYGNFECWDGICPGSTTFDGAVTLLEEKHGKQNVTIDHRGNSIRWESDEDDRFPRGSISSQHGVVDEIRLGVNQLTVEEVIDQLGEPAFVHVVMAFSSDYPCAGAIIRYPNKGVLAYLDQEYGSATIGIIPNQEIQGLTILSPDRAENWFMYDTAVVEWQGYTDYCRLAFPYRFEDSG
jgi:hypothetical protein